MLFSVYESTATRITFLVRDEDDLPVTATAFTAWARHTATGEMVELTAQPTEVPGELVAHALFERAGEWTIALDVDEPVHVSTRATGQVRPMPPRPSP